MRVRLLFLVLTVIWLCAARGEDSAEPLLYVQQLRAAENLDALKHIAGRETGTLDELARAACERLAVRIEFYLPNDTRQPDARYFAPGAEEGRRFPWERILLVDARPGKEHKHAAAGRFQLRARVVGLEALIAAKDAAAERFPLRLYRTFVNEVSDDEEVYERALKGLHGAVEKDAAGKAREPAGRVVELKRIAGLGGREAVFVSEPIDIAADQELNPALAGVPASAAAFDCDAFFTQEHRAPGDQEADGFALVEALKKRGFVSGGVAHPWPKTFRPQWGDAEPYRFAVALGDPEALGLDGLSYDAERAEGFAARTKVARLAQLLRESERARFVKNLGASRVLGRPVSNGAFIAATGVQKLVASARARAEGGDGAWRFPGAVHASDGSMDQVLVRAPAHVFLFSGHGYKPIIEGEKVPVVNTYSYHNPAAIRESRVFQVFAAAELPRPGSWGHIAAETAPENRIDLSEKWLPGEVNLRWLLIAGCQTLDPGRDPFQRRAGGAGSIGHLVVERLGAKGVLGFSRYGFSGEAFLTRFVDEAARAGPAFAWRKVWRDDEARRYTWHERNEAHGRSERYDYASKLSGITPAYLVRQAHLAEPLSPASVLKEAQKGEVEFLIMGDSPERQIGSFRP